MYKNHREFSKVLSEFFHLALYAYFPFTMCVDYHQISRIHFCSTVQLSKEQAASPDTQVVINCEECGTHRNVEHVDDLLVVSIHNNRVSLALREVKNAIRRELKTRGELRRTNHSVLRVIHCACVLRVKLHDFQNGPKSCGKAALVICPSCITILETKS